MGIVPSTPTTTGIAVTFMYYNYNWKPYNYLHFIGFRLDFLKPYNCENKLLNWNTWNHVIVYKLSVLDKKYCVESLWRNG